MLAYVTDRPAARTTSLRTLILVIAAHLFLLALVLTARGEMPGINKPDPTQVIFIDPIKPPPPPPPASAPDRPSDLRSIIDSPPVIVPTPQPRPTPIDDGPPLTDLSPTIGNAIVPLPLPLPQPPVTPIVRKAARFATPAADIRPPYPEAKRRLEEEASLRLTLQIDERGRVVSVDSVGAADAAFLDSARRHILRRWRYQPATEGGVAIPARIQITLRFEIDE
ncbi:MAG TPA: energy transducer TonB [Sphingomicrobium sp.]|nr:energy transducer TonB [Sphingomicrobium sp.]